MTIFEPQTREFQDTFVKVTVPLEPNAWHRFRQEAMWARKVGNDLYELQNTPFFAKGLAYLDVVRAEPREGSLTVIEPITRSRHSTYRIFVEHSDTEVKRLIQQLTNVGCSHESYKTEEWVLYAVDVPPKSVDGSFKLLQEGETLGLWDFDEGHFGGRDQ